MTAKILKFEGGISIKNGIQLKSNVASEVGGVAFGTADDTSLFRSAAGVLSVGGVAGASPGAILTSSRSILHNWIWSGD